MDHSMENSRIIGLMAKKLGKSASAAELEELDRLLEEYPSYSHLAEIVQSLKGGREHFEKTVPAQELTDTGWKHLADRLSSEEDPAGLGAPVMPEDPAQREPRQLGSHKIKIWRWTAAAAALVLISAGALWYDNGNKPAPHQDKSLDVSYGAQKTLILSDGTRIWLNAGSHLVYPERFSGSTREVTLEGEAFFDVAPRPSVPFLVHAGKITVKVLGTRFDVKAYRADANITTTLISGKVQVTLDNDPERNVTLVPHEKLVVANAEAETPPLKEGPSRNELRYQVRYLLGNDKDSSLAETAWLDNKLVFSDDLFQEVARQLERKYNVEIGFANEGLKEEHLSGVFDKETLQQVLDILRMTTRFDYRMEGKKIVLVKALR